MIFDDCDVLFPSSIEDQGKSSYKGVDYVAAAFQQVNLSKREIRGQAPGAGEFGGRGSCRHDALCNKGSWAKALRALRQGVGKRVALGLEI